MHNFFIFEEIAWLEANCSAPPHSALSTQIDFREGLFHNSLTVQAGSSEARLECSSLS